MTRKHYIMLAEVINEARKRKCTLARLSEMLGAELQKDNASFNINRFLEACGFQDNC